MKNGFSLIEVLVSLLILAVGIIGSAGMQLTAMRTAQQSAFHTYALHLAIDMADAMRFVHQHVQQPSSADQFAGIDYKAAVDGEPARPAKLCYAEECNTQELVAFEIYGWKTRVKTALPQGRVVVCRDAAPMESSTVNLRWECDAGAGGAAPLVIKLGWQAKNPDGSLIRNADRAFPPAVALPVAI